MDAHFAVFLAIFAVLSASLVAAQDDVEAEGGKSISCYTCTNSKVPGADGELDQYYSAGCADEFNPSGSGADVVKEACEARAPKCFKSKQTMIDGGTGAAYQLVTRGCAGPDVKETGCSFSKGASKGESHLCYCSTGDCNGAAEMGSHMITTSLAVVLSVVVYRLF